MHILITSVIDLQKTSYSRLHHFIEHLLGKGHRITVIGIKDNWKHKGILQNQELISRINMLYLTDKEYGLVRQKLGAMLLAKKLLKQAGKVDVHLCYNSLILGYIVASELKKHNINTVYDLADDLPEMIKASPHIPKPLRALGGKVGEFMLIRNLTLAKAVTYTAKEFERTMDVKKYNSYLLPNGVDVRRFKPGTAKHNGIIVGYVGALREWVDLRPMLLAVKNLAAKKFPVKVLVVGGEEDLAQYKQFVAEQQMEKLVEFTGNVPYKDVQKYVSKMDICTVPFKKNKVTDGTNPLKLLEYLACEKPAIVSWLNEPQNMLGDKILYADTVDEWEKQILLLSKNPKLRQRMGRDGRKIVQRDYDWKRICERLENIILESK